MMTIYCILNSAVYTRLPAFGLLLLCHCWCIAACLGVLLPPVVQWNRVKPGVKPVNNSNSVCIKITILRMKCCFDCAESISLRQQHMSHYLAGPCEKLKRYEVGKCYLALCVSTNEKNATLSAGEEHTPGVPYYRKTMVFMAVLF